MALKFFPWLRLWYSHWSEVAQSCPTLWDPMDCSLPGSSVHGIFQARVLEWGAIAKKDEMKVKVKSLSHVPLFVTPCTVAHQAPLSTEFSRQEYWSALTFPSPWDLPNPGIKPRVSHIAGRCFYCLSHQGSPRQLRLTAIKTISVKVE